MKTKWRPIKTAPHNQHVLVCGGLHMSGPSVAYKRTYFRHGQNSEEWVMETTGSVDEEISEPRWWMPLPDPPQALRARAGGSPSPWGWAI